MNPATLLQGKGAKPTGWAAVIIGVLQLFQLAGQLMAQGAATCIDIVGPILHSEGILVVLGGLAVVFFSHSQDANAEKLKDHLSEKVDEKLPNMLKQLLTELENRKEPKP